jgi:hypothetical protein
MKSNSKQRNTEPLTSRFFENDLCELPESNNISIYGRVIVCTEDSSYSFKYDCKHNERLHLILLLSYVVKCDEKAGDPVIKI